MLGVGTHETVASLLTIAENVAVYEPTDFTVHHRTADAGTSAELGKGHLSVGVPECLSKDRPDRIGAHEGCQLRRSSLHGTRRYLPDMGKVKRGTYTRADDRSRVTITA
ncbi:hypothetical protein GCM10009625_03140 [Brachybacterium fresconis]